MPPAVTATDVPTDELHGDDHHRPGQDAADEEIGDRQVHHEAVDDEDDRGRNDDADRAAGRRRGGREMPVVAALDHLGMHDRADRRGGRRVGARDGGEQAAGAQRCHRQPAPQPAEEGIGEAGETARDARAVDEVAREDEERHRQQGEAVGEDVGERRADVVEGEAENEARAHHPDADHQEDRHPEGEEDGDADRDQQDPGAVAHRRPVTRPP